MLVWSCIAPHGGELIPELAQSCMPRMAVTREAMFELGRRCQGEQPETVVVLSPHGVQTPDSITVSANEFAEGTLGGDDGSSVGAGYSVDLELAESIIERCGARGVPATPIAFADERYQPLPFHLDWGAFIPLWFMGSTWNPRPRIVVLCPSRSLPRTTLVEAGQAIAQVCADSDRRVALICSADQGHGHDAEGPYGFAPESAEYDEAYVSALRRDSLESMLEWDAEWIGCALTDSYWQTLMLHGALKHIPMRPELLSYEAPTYFGMACAAFHRRP
jgi:aromatic ring-opening dioxygenase LigB subunit